MIGLLILFVTLGLALFMTYHELRGQYLNAQDQVANAKPLQKRLLEDERKEHVRKSERLEASHHMVLDAEKGQTRQMEEKGQGDQVQIRTHC